MAPPETEAPDAGTGLAGARRSVVSADGTRIGLLTAGTGPALLLVHGGMSRLERWAPVWDRLARRWRVTAMDRRGRGTSADTVPYQLSLEFDDVTAVAATLAGEQGAPVDVFGHSYGATCVLGAAASGAPFRRIVLYESPGPRAVSEEWVARITGLIASGQTRRAVISFLTEVVGLTREQIMEARETPGAADSLRIAADTLPREAVALATADLPGLASEVAQPVLLLLGSESPAWASSITYELAAALPESEMVVLPGAGHEAIDAAPDLTEAELVRFLT